MKNSFFVLTAVVAAALVSGPVAGGTVSATAKFEAALTVRQETDHPKGTKPAASGQFTATLTGKTLKWKLTWKNLSGPAHQAHIHLGKRGISGNVLVPLCPPGCTSPNHGTATLTAVVIKAMKAGGTYVNVHTNKNFNGEIRGQITVVK